MTYRIEVLTCDGWRPVRPSSPAGRAIKSEPYEFKTEGDAKEMARLCYDGDASKVRITGND